MQDRLSSGDGWLWPDHVHVHGGRGRMRQDGRPRPNRIHQTDANGHVVAMTYDDLNRLVEMTQDPGGLGFVTRHAYDENGNETVLTDAKGQTVTSTFDELNRVKTKAYAFAPADPVRPWRHTTGVVYTYDPNNNLVEADESVASGTEPPATTLTTTRAWDLLDRLTSETTTLPDGGTRTVGHTYFANGTRKTVTDPEGGETAYTYDGQNRLETATTAAGATTYTYYPDDLLQDVTYPNGVKASHTYDKADRLRTLVNARGATTVSSYTYSYDGNGNRLTQVESNGGTTETTTYTYDALDRLKTVTYPVDTAFPSGRVVTYVYDAVGNRLRETERTAAGALLADKQGIFDNANRLAELDDLVDPSKTTVFAWDANGNQTSKTVGGGVPTFYRYDIRDKMVETVQGPNALGRFQYDFEGRRTKKIGLEGLRQYVYDQTSLFEEYDEFGAQRALYNYGSDRLISLYRSDEGRRFYSFDGLRSVVNLTADDGSTAASYHLSAWGEYRFPSELDSSRNRFGFTGFLWDQETSLYFAKARYLDPATARFTSQDSFLGNVDNPPSLHRYFYANANPTRYIDITGHETGSPMFYYQAPKPSMGEHIDPKLFFQEFGTRALNVLTLGGSGGLQRAYDEGRLDARSGFGETLSAYSAGVINGITFGGADEAVRVRVNEGKGYVRSAASGTGTALSGVVGVDEMRTLADPKKDSWEKSEAAASLVAKWASLGAGGARIAKGRGVGVGTPKEAPPAAPLNAPEASVVTETKPTTGGVEPATEPAVGATEPQAAAPSGTASSAPAPKKVYIDPAEHPGAAGHIADAQAAGKPRVVTVERTATSARRRASTRQNTEPKTAATDIDEYPPASTAEGGAGASTRRIPSGDNRGAGAVYGNQIRDVPNGGQVEIVVGKKPPAEVPDPLKEN